jgi:hypothetical protein
MYRKWAYTIYIQMLCCHDYMPSSGSQGPSSVADHNKKFEILKWKRNLPEKFKPMYIQIRAHMYGKVM